MADFDAGDWAVVGGLGLGGLGLGIYSWAKKQKAQSKFKEALAAINADMAANPKDYAKLRDISGVDANIKSFNDASELLMGKENAFFTPGDAEGLTGKKLLAPKVKSEDGTIAMGSENRSLPTLAHELGHGKNSKTGKLAERDKKRMLWRLGGWLTAVSSGFLGRSAINNAAANGDIPSNQVKWWGMAPIALGTAIGSIGDYMSDSYTLEEEDEATKNALKFLKAYGRLPKELRKDKQLLNYALDTYKQARISGLLDNIGSGLRWSALGYGIHRMGEPSTILDRGEYV